MSDRAPPPSAEDPAADLEHLLRVMPMPARVMAASARIISEVRQLRVRVEGAEARVRKLTDEANRRSQD